MKKNRFGIFYDEAFDPESYYNEAGLAETHSPWDLNDEDLPGPDIPAEDLLGSDEGYDVEGYDDEEDNLAVGCNELSDEDMRRLGIVPPTASTPEAVGPNRRIKHLSALVAQVVADNRLRLSEDGRAYVYREGLGCFQPIPQLSAYLAEFFGADIVSSLSSRDMKEIAERLSWESAICCSPDDFNHNSELVNFHNGVVNTQTDELSAHDARYMFTYQLNADYLCNDEDIICPAFEEFCRTSLNNSPAKRQLLLEFIGYVLLDSNAGKCALFFKGAPNSGKSVMTTFIARLFDSVLVSHVPLHQLGDRFFRAELAGRKLNTAGEIAGRALQDVSIFKSITGGDRIVGEFKGCNPFYFTPQCKLLFSGNTLPLTTETDATHAFLNRIRVLLFNQSIDPDRQDKLLLEKLWGERDAIVTLALHAAQELVKRNFEFTLPEDSEQYLKSFSLRGNVLTAFIEECCILDAEARVFNVELYAAFEAFSKRNGLKALSRMKFYELLSGLPNVSMKRLRIGPENRWGHGGIALKDKA